MTSSLDYKIALLYTLTFFLILTFLLYSIVYATTPLVGANSHANTCCW
jgi:hypothetical protein